MTGGDKTAAVLKLAETEPGLRRSEVAKRVGASREWIRQLDEKHGLPFRKGPPGPRPKFKIPPIFRTRRRKGPFTWHCAVCGRHFILKRQSAYFLRTGRTKEALCPKPECRREYLARLGAERSLQGR